MTSRSQTNKWLNKCWTASSILPAAKLARTRARNRLPWFAGCCRVQPLPKLSCKRTQDVSNLFPRAKEDIPLLCLLAVKQDSCPVIEWVLQDHLPLALTGVRWQSALQVRRWGYKLAEKKFIIKLIWYLLKSRSVLSLSSKRCPWVTWNYQWNHRWIQHNATFAAICNFVAAFCSLTHRSGLKGILKNPTTSAPMVPVYCAGEEEAKEHPARSGAWMYTPKTEETLN